MQSIVMSRLILAVGALALLAALTTGRSPGTSLPLPPEVEGDETRLTVRMLRTAWRSPAEIGDFYRRDLETRGWLVEQEAVEVFPSRRWRLVATRPGRVLVAKWWYEGDALRLSLEVLDENLDRG